MHVYEFKMYHVDGFICTPTISGVLYLCVILGSACLII